MESKRAHKLPVVGVLGGGQLGRMMAMAAHRLGLQLVVLDPQGHESPAGLAGARAIQGSFTDEQSIAQLAQQCDVLTIEIEHVNASFLQQLTDHKPGIRIVPSPSTIALIQDKYKQKCFFKDVEHVQVAPFMAINSLDDAKLAGNKFGYPFMLKSRCFAYDGRGNAVVKTESDLPQAFARLGVTDSNVSGRLYAEQWVHFTKEMAVMVVKRESAQNHQVVAYPVVETTQANSICHTVLAPARLSSEKIRCTISQMALQAISQLDGSGIYGVELFVTQDDQVFLNEIAPRPHNSGHYTIEACETDQFENHLRAVCDLPLGSCNLRVNSALMVNVLGAPSGDEQESFQLLHKCLSVPGATTHCYGKKEVRAGRKLAHFTIVANSLRQLRERVHAISPQIAQDADLVRVDEDSTPLVGIVMGSDSDLPTMAAAAQVLEDFAVPYELSIVSAHRTPGRMYEYAQSATSRGLRVIIAGAGGAAHLPGMVAALTPLPVIGVPIKTSTLNGQDSLLSIVQMPKGVPVATVAIGNAANAGLLAVRMLGGEFTDLMRNFLETQREEVDGKINRMAVKGWKKYLQDMTK